MAVVKTLFLKQTAESQEHVMRKGTVERGAARAIEFKGSRMRIEMSLKTRTIIPQEMQYLSLSRFVRLEDEFLRGKEDRLEMILNLLKKREDVSEVAAHFQSVVAMRRQPSSSKYRRMAHQADCKHY